MSTQNSISIKFTSHTIKIFFLALAVVLIALLLHEIILLLFLSILFAAAVNPLVKYLSQAGISRPLSISLVYILIILSVSVLLLGLLPPLTNQLAKLISQENIPHQLIDELSIANINLQQIEIILSNVNSIPRIMSVINSIFSLLAYLLTIFVITFYLLLERPHIHRHLSSLMGQTKTEKYAESFIAEFESHIGSWVRGELVLMTAIGSATYVSLVLIQVPYALPLSIIAAFLELIPNIGPMISAIPAILIALFSLGPLQAVLVLCAYILIQQLENNVLVPTVMRHTINLNPILTIIIILSGFKLGGVMGALIAIPLTLALKSAYIQFRRYQHATK